MKISMTKVQNAMASAANSAKSLSLKSFQAIRTALKSFFPAKANKVDTQPNDIKALNKSMKELRSQTKQLTKASRQHQTQMKALRKERRSFNKEVRGKKRADLKATRELKAHKRKLRRDEARIANLLRDKVKPSGVGRHTPKVAQDNTSTKQFDKDLQNLEDRLEKLKQW